jgi:hypothetical protein
MSFDTSVTRASVQRLQREHLRQDRVVAAVARQVVGQGRGELAGLEVEPPGRGFLAVVARVAGRQGQARVDGVLLGIPHQLVEEAADLAHVARGLRQALLVGVEFLEHDHRQVDIVFFEAEDRGRVVHQHIRVEHEDAPFAGRAAVLHGARAVRVASPLQGLPPRDPSP